LGHPRSCPFFSFHIRISHSFLLLSHGVFFSAVKQPRRRIAAILPNSHFRSASLPFSTQPPSWWFFLWEPFGLVTLPFLFFHIPLLLLTLTLFPSQSPSLGHGFRGRTFLRPREIGALPRFLLFPANACATDFAALLHPLPDSAGQTISSRPPLGTFPPVQKLLNFSLQPLRYPTA